MMHFATIASVLRLMLFDFRLTAPTDSLQARWQKKTVVSFVRAGVLSYATEPCCPSKRKVSGSPRTCGKQCLAAALPPHLRKKNFAFEGGKLRKSKSVVALHCVQPFGEPLTIAC